MSDDLARTPIAIVGVGAILPDAPDAATFWENIKGGRYSISEVTPELWDPQLYYDPDPKAPDKTYSKIGGIVRGYAWDPLAWKLAVPPKVADAMDRGQKWAIACTREALADYGYPERPLDRERTAVILGNAMAGDKHYRTALRVAFPELAAQLDRAPSFASLPATTRAAILEEARAGFGKSLPPITEDTMPGELANVIAGRVAQLFDLHGQNFVCDAACASAMAAIAAASRGLAEGEFDAVISGGIDANMSASTFVKFSKIGALSATGTRPFAQGADGFVMGEGAAVFLLKRLADAEQAGDRIYAVIRGVGGASDGKGKGITAPNPKGQILAIQRAWDNAGLSPASATLIEAHGTSTRVGDVVEVTSLVEAFREHPAPAGSIALGSVKSNIGHLKAAAGAAGLLKAVLSLRDRVLPPSLGFQRPNPDIDFARSPFFVNTQLREWNAEPRLAGVSAFGFGGTNFHVALEEYVPRARRAPSMRAHGSGAHGASAGDAGSAADSNTAASGAYGDDVGSAALRGNGQAEGGYKQPLRGVLLAGGVDDSALRERLRVAPPGAPEPRDLTAPRRVAIDFGDQAELDVKRNKALKALDKSDAGVWKALRAQGIFAGKGAPGKVAFLFTGQGSQYVNMLRELREVEPIVAQTFAEADRVMTPILGRALSDCIFVAAERASEAEAQLKQTAITQPAILATDLALARLLKAYGVVPDMVMGHSLGEYAALVAAGALSFADALRAVAARGSEMTRVSVADNGAMIAVFAPLAEIERTLQTIDGYVVVANVNAPSQAVVGGATDAVERARHAFEASGFRAVPLSVSHAFHTSIVAPASDPLKRVLATLDLAQPKLPLISNVTGQWYPQTVAQIIELLGRQIAEPVQFVRGLETLYASGARVFIEVGPKRALAGLADEVFADKSDVTVLSTNHPKLGDLVSFNHALCGLYAAGLGQTARPAPSEARPPLSLQVPAQPAPVAASGRPHASHGSQDIAYDRLGRVFVEAMQRGQRILGGALDLDAEPVVITGAGLGLPGGARVFDDANVARLLEGEQLIDVIPVKLRRALVDKHITRLVKSDSEGPRFQTIDSPADVIKLAGRAGALDLDEEFGVPADRLPALATTTRLAIAAGLEALRDAGIPLCMHYKTTTLGTQLPDRYMLPPALRDETGVIFASAFPSYDALAEDMQSYCADHARRERLADLTAVRERLSAQTEPAAVAEVERRMRELQHTLAQSPYALDRRYVFRILSMGHSQFAEYIGARGPNTQVNSACASGSLALSLAEDWIRTGRARRVVIVSADDVTSNALLEWIGAGFLASGAAATEDVVEDVAVPFDRRRHGLVLGMGATAMVVEAPSAAAERGLTPIAELLGTQVGNSAFHGSRLDVEHIAQVMERLVSDVEHRHGLSREQIAAQSVFVSHETYTPARGGSAQAEVTALRRVFGAHADRIVIANTKGFTGHAMGAAVEEAVAIKILETGIVPPVANFRELDPQLGALNLSRGGSQPVRYALRLGAGFGSQIAMAVLRWTPPPDGVHHAPDALGYAYRVADQAQFRAWLSRVSGELDPELEVVKRTLRVRDSGLRNQRAARPMAARGAPQPAITLPRAAAEASGRSVAFAAEASVPPTEPARATALSPSTAASASAAAASATARDEVTARVLSIVSEQTGYPVDMLEPELDLEADLGIDTVKQAETFAAVREAYAIPRDAGLKLKDFPTLAHVVRWVKDRTGSAVQPRGAGPALEAPKGAGSAVPAAESGANAAAADDVLSRVMSIVSEQTGYPADMLEPDLDLEADLGIDTVKQAETFAAVREAYAIPRDAGLKLKDFPTLAHVVRWVKDRTGSAVQARGAEPGLEAPETVIGPEAPAAIAAESGASAAAPDDVLERVLSIVSEQTGYPADMLEPDLDLEADLGIDTVKQAETFAAVREAYAIPRDAGLKLKDFPTLAHVVRWVKEHTSASQSHAEVDADETDKTVQAQPTGAVLRRVPIVVMRPPLELCKPTAVSLDAGARVVIVSGGEVGPALAALLQARGVNAVITDPIHAHSALSEGPVVGIYWLAALEDEGDPLALTPEAFHAALDARVKALARVARAFHGELEKGRFLIAATRLGGRHGVQSAATAPLGGAVTGFVKALKRERPEATVKAVDFGVSDAERIAERLLAETTADPGVVEVGYADEQRVTIALTPAPTEAPEPAHDSDRVYLVTGAAGSIVSAIVADLCVRGGVFYLLDIAPEPDSSDEDLRWFARDREEFKRELAHRAHARAERTTPAMIEKQLAAIERQVAAQAARAAIESAGGQARYRRVDLRDSVEVAAIVDEVRERHGRIDVLLHAAGLEVSRLLPSKTDEEFERVFDVKVLGYYNLLHALGDMPLGACVAFSSIAGRFGNAGQTDYAAANDLLCKLTSYAARARPDTQSLVIDWTAWADIGMATRGSIPKLMAAAGIDMLPSHIGIPLVGTALRCGYRGELVVAGALGLLEKEWDDTGGLDCAAVAAGGPMIEHVVGWTIAHGLTIETTLDPAREPFLFDHQIEGKPVLPGVMGIEAFAEAATLVLGEFRLSAIEDVSFHAPLKFYRGEPRILRIEAQLCPQDSEQIIAACRLTGTRSLAGHDEPVTTTHFTAGVRLTRQAPAPLADTLPKTTHAPVGSDAVYRIYFHGPAYQVLASAARNGAAILGELARPLPPDHSHGITVTPARLVELCFQTAGIWEIGTTGRLALPQHIDKLVVFGEPPEDAPVFAVVTPRPDGSFDARIMDKQGHVFLTLEGYRTVTLGEVDEALRAPLIAAVQP